MHIYILTASSGPGRPRERWIDQVREDSAVHPANLWRRAISRGQLWATLRPSGL